MNRRGIGVHNLKLQKSRKQIWRGEHKVSACRLGGIPCHTRGLAGDLSKGVGVGSDIDEKASFDHIVQHWDAVDVGIDIADYQSRTFGLGLDFEQNGPNKLVGPPRIGRVLAAASVTV